MIVIDQFAAQYLLIPSAILGVTKLRRCAIVSFSFDRNVVIERALGHRVEGLRFVHIWCETVGDGSPQVWQVHAASIFLEFTQFVLGHISTLVYRAILSVTSQEMGPIASAHLLWAHHRASIITVVHASNLVLSSIGFHGRQRLRLVHNSGRAQRFWTHFLVRCHCGVKRD